MASTTSTKMMEEATCSISLSLMMNPVSINCGHMKCHVRNMENSSTCSPKMKDSSSAGASFLHEEEKDYLWRLEKEEQRTLSRLKDHEASLSLKSDELKSRILELEEKCQGSAQKLLQNVNDTLSKSWAAKLETSEAVSLELHAMCSVSELYFDVKKMLRSHQVSVTLDSDTAHHELILSEDGR
ncbi:E3 ubiquitin-protein ligase TRIM38 [Plecturocebus cupreus]